jgi:hypothetical protein
VASAVGPEVLPSPNCTVSCPAKAGELQGLGPNWVTTWAVAPAAIEPLQLIVDPGAWICAAQANEPVPPETVAVVAPAPRLVAIWKPPLEIAVSQETSI